MARAILTGLMLHEGVPGHLLQFHVVDESPHLSDLRRQLRSSAFAEGWAMYASSLWMELGLDLTAKVQITRLAGQRFVPMRTVLETGIHNEGWSRERAVEYYKKTMPWAPEAMDGVVDGAASSRLVSVLLRRRAEDQDAAYARRTGTRPRVRHLRVSR